MPRTKKKLPADMPKIADFEVYSVTQLRKATGLTQTEFGKLYKIPMRTVQNWEAREAEPDSEKGRQLPDWALYMLNRLVREDFPAAFSGKPNIRIAD